MGAHLRLVQSGEAPHRKTPHYNLRTLQRKAASALHHIASSGFENFRYPSVWVRYLRNVLEKLQDENPPPVHDLAQVELDLEAIESGMLHMNITSRPVEVLLLPRGLPIEMIDRLEYLKHKMHPPIPPHEVPLKNRYNLIPLRRRQGL